MKVGRKTEFVLLGVAAIALVSSQGCSIFRSNFTSPDEANSFHGTASTMNNPVPLPVEIVSDISSIQSGGQIQQQGVWRPTFEEDGDLSAVRVPSPGEPVKTAEPQVESDQIVQANQEPVADNPYTTAAETSVEDDVKVKTKRRPTSVRRGGKTQSYRVRRGDTLMKISFEKFGNVYRWREILDANKGTLGKSTELTVGQNLTIAGVEYVVIERNGQPYLIKKRDTLAKISNGVYGTPREWPRLWKNNRQLIHDPNKIYAGFTLYYQPMKTTAGAIRGVTSVAKTEPVPRKPEAIKIDVSVPTGIVPPSGPEAWKPSEN